MNEYLITVFRKDGKILAETFRTQKNAMASYRRLVEPNNFDSLNRLVIFSKVMMEAESPSPKRK